MILPDYDALWLNSGSYFRYFFAKPLYPTLGIEKRDWRYRKISDRLINDHAEALANLIQCAQMRPCEHAVQPIAAKQQNDQKKVVDPVEVKCCERNSKQRGDHTIASRHKQPAPGVHHIKVQYACWGTGWSSYQPVWCLVDEWTSPKAGRHQ